MVKGRFSCQKLHDRHLRNQRLAEVEGQHVLQEDEVLLPERHVEPQLAPEQGELIRRRKFAEGDERGVAGQEAQGDEDERQDEEHRRHGIEQSRPDDAAASGLASLRRALRG